MSRAYHSCSGAELIMRCPKAAAYQYIDKLREPHIPWRVFEQLEREGKGRGAYSILQRAGSFGTEVHATLEHFWHGKRPRWDHFPGQVAEAMLEHLPDPTLVKPRIERPIGAGVFGCTPIDVADDHAPPVGLSIEGILWAGFVDLEVENATEALTALNFPEVHAHNGVAIFDYKSISKLELAKSRGELQHDLQCNLYGYNSLMRTGLDVVPARWVYGEKDKYRAVKRSIPVEVTIPRQRALDVIGPAAAACKEFDLIERSQDAPENRRACGWPTLYAGGCRFHETQGGPCKARRSIGALSQLYLRDNRRKKEMNEARSKFAEMKKSRTEAAKQKNEEATEATALEEPAPAETQPKPRTRKKRTAKKATKKTAVSPTANEDAIAEMSTKLPQAKKAIVDAETLLSDAEEAAANAKDDLDRAVGAYRELLDLISKACAEVTEG